MHRRFGMLRSAQVRVFSYELITRYTKIHHLKISFTLTGDINVIRDISYLYYPRLQSRTRSYNIIINRGSLSSPHPSNSAYLPAILSLFTFLQYSTFARTATQA